MKLIRRIGSVTKHVLLIGMVLFLLVILPLIFTGYFTDKTEGADAVSSASIVIDEPSGNYIVFINTQKHNDKEKLASWIDFFSGEEITFIFEDIRCCVAYGDSQGLLMAQSFQSKLPEHQMTIRQEDAILMLSKAEHGRYDIIIMSKEMADAYHAETLSRYEYTQAITIKDNEE